MGTFYLKSQIRTFSLIAFLILPFLVQAQYSNCVNMDFSAGNFTNWTGYTSCYPFDTPGSNVANPGNNGVPPIANYYYTKGIVNGRQTIMISPTADPFTCGNLMTIPPGEKYAARLGNGGIGPWGDGVAWQRDFLTYDFVVSSRTSLLTVKYAVVMQNPALEPNGINNHTKALTPRFAVSIVDTLDHVIDSLCMRREIYYDSTNTIFHRCPQTEMEKLGAQAKFPGDVYYTDWITVSLDLSKYTGQTLRVKFETWDCGLGGHFGYAYVSAKCVEARIDASACQPVQQVTLTAPEGFSYQWVPSGDTTQSIVVDSVKFGDTAEVVLTSKFGCKTTLRRYLFKDTPLADFNLPLKTCIDVPTQFTDLSLPAINEWSWDFGDGTTDTVPNPVHIYKKEGNYAVQLWIKNRDGCEDSVSKSIYVCPESGIHDTEKKLIIHAFPNPSTGTFKLQIEQANSSNVHISISNILGQLIYTESNVVRNGILQKELDLKEQPDGIYFVTLQNAEVSSTIKLVKRN